MINFFVYVCILFMCLKARYYCIIDIEYFRAKMNKFEMFKNRKVQNQKKSGLRLRR